MLSENSLVWTFVFLLKCDKMTKNRRPAGNGLDAGRREAGGRIEQSNRQNFCSQTLFKGELWQSLIFLKYKDVKGHEKLLLENAG